MALSTVSLAIIIVVSVIAFIICHIPICWQFYRLVKKARAWYRRRNQVPKQFEDLMFSTIPDGDIAAEEGRVRHHDDSDSNAAEPLVKGLRTADSFSPAIPELKNIDVKKRIGEGSFGEVFLGLWNDTKVALKKLKGLDEFEEFKAETGVLFSVIHPNCVQFLGVYQSEESKEFFIVLGKNVLIDPLDYINVF